MPSTNLLSFNLFHLDGTIIPEYMMNQPKDQFHVETVIQRLDRPIRMEVCNNCIQPSIQISNTESQSIGRLVMILLIDEEMVFAHTLNRVGCQFQVNGKRTALDQEIPFNITKQCKITCQVWKVHIKSEERCPSYWNHASAMYCDEESLDGSRIRSFEFGFDEEKPVLSFTIHHVPGTIYLLDFKPDQQALPPTSIMSTRKLYNYFEFSEKKPLSHPETKYVNIVTESKSIGRVPSFVSKSKRFNPMLKPHSS